MRKVRISRAILVGCGALVLCAIFLRFAELGALGFYGDEETTAYAASSLVEKGAAEMPSGMAYRRATIFTWLNGIAVSVLGSEHESSYRVVAASFGVLTVILLLIGLPAHVSVSVAFLSAMLLTFSEWHIVISRYARMYSPFLFLYLASSLAFIRGMAINSKSLLLLGFILFALCFETQIIAVPALLYLLLPLVFYQHTPRLRATLIFCVLVAVYAGILFNSFYTSAPYNEWTQPLDLLEEQPTGKISVSSVLARLTISGLHLALAVSSALAFALPGFRKSFDVYSVEYTNWLRFVLTSLGVLTGFFAGLGEIYAVAMFGILFSIIHPLPLNRIIKSNLVSFAAITAVCGGWLLYRVSVSGVVEGLKDSLDYPFNYMAIVAEKSPGLTAVFLVSCVYYAFCARTSRDKFVRICICGVILTLIIIGAISEWGGARYLLGTYPFLIISVACFVNSMVELAAKVTQTKYQYILGAVAVLSVTGLLSDVNIYNALKVPFQTYGPRSSAYILPYYPDHKGAGQYIKSQLREEDIVVASEALTQKWYIGRVDYWLGDARKKRGYAYVDSHHAERDIYISAKLVHDRDWEYLTSQKKRRVWIVLSAEKAGREDDNFSSIQKEFVDSLALSQTPYYSGRDGYSHVYCINCDSFQKDVSPRE